MIDIDQTITTGTCAACRLPDQDVTMPDPEAYPGAVADPVCATCPPMRPIELGAASLTDPTPAERAHAESVWRNILDPGTPCRCSGNGVGADGTPVPCHHGEPCTTCGGGGILHYDRYAVGLISAPTSWMDEYMCSSTACSEAYSTEIRLTDLPWGVVKRYETGPYAGDFAGYELYDGIRHAQLHTSDGENA